MQGFYLLCHSPSPQKGNIEDGLLHMILCTKCFKVLLNNGSLAWRTPVASHLSLYLICTLCIKGKVTRQCGSLGPGPFPADHKFLMLSAIRSALWNFIVIMLNIRTFEGSNRPLTLRKSSISALVETHNTSCLLSHPFIHSWWWAFCQLDTPRIICKGTSTVPTGTSDWPIGESVGHVLDWWIDKGKPSLLWMVSPLGKHVSCEPWGAS